MIETLAERDDAPHDGLPRGRGDHARSALKAAIRQRYSRHRSHPGAVRLLVQEQGRADAARRRGRLPAVADRRSRRWRASTPATARPVARRADDDEPFAAIAFKIMSDPVRRQAHLLPGVFGHAQSGLLRLQLEQGQEGARRPHPADARQPPRGHHPGVRRRHRRGRGPQGHDDGRHPLRREQRRSILEVHRVPRAGHLRGHRAQDQGRPGPAWPRA